MPESLKKAYLCENSSSSSESRRVVRGNLVVNEAAVPHSDFCTAHGDGTTDIRGCVVFKDTPADYDFIPHSRNRWRRVGRFLLKHALADQMPFHMGIQRSDKQGVDNRMHGHRLAYKAQSSISAHSAWEALCTALNHCTETNSLVIAKCPQWSPQFNRWWKFSQNWEGWMEC